MSDWARVRRRHRLVHDAAGDVAKHGTGALDRWRPAIEAEYGDLDGFLRDVQRRYHTAVEARLDAVIEEAPADPRPAVAAAFAEAAKGLPDLWRLLDAVPGHPALSSGDVRLRRSVQAATGVDPATLPLAGERRPDRGPRRLLACVAGALKPA